MLLSITQKGIMGKLYIPVFSKGKLKDVYKFEEGGPSLLVMRQLSENGKYILKFPLRNKMFDATNNVVGIDGKQLENAIRNFESWQKDPGKF